MTITNITLLPVRLEQHMRTQGLLALTCLKWIEGIYYTHYVVWGVITHPCTTSCRSYTKPLEIRIWVSNQITLFPTDVTTDPICWYVYIVYYWPSSLRYICNQVLLSLTWSEIRILITSIVLCGMWLNFHEFRAWISNQIPLIYIGVSTYPRYMAINIVYHATRLSLGLHIDCELCVFGVGNLCKLKPIRASVGGPWLNILLHINNRLWPNWKVIL